MTSNGMNSHHGIPRQSISAPTSNAEQEQQARLAARSWNFRVKQKHKYSTTKIDRPLTEGDGRYNYDSTFTQNITRKDVKLTNAVHRVARGRRSDVGVIPMCDVASTFDELFEREVVHIPPRMEIASQAVRLNKLIKKAEAASSFSLSKSLITVEKPCEEPGRLRRHASLAKLLSTEQCDVEEVHPDLPEIEPSAVDSQDPVHMEAKFRCLMNRDITFIHTLPQSSNYPLTTLIGETWKSYNDGRYNECLDQLKKCILLNTDAVNRPILFFNQAVVLAHLGEFTRAMTELNEAIKLEPEVPKYFKLRSVLWRVKEKYIEASKDSKRAATIEQNKAGHKHIHNLAHRALKTISIIHAGSKAQQVPTKKNLFEDAYEIPPANRNQNHLDILIENSSQIPCLAKVQQEILHVLWRNLTCITWQKETIIHVANYTISLYILLEGSIAVQTNHCGVKEIHQILQPGNVFGESTISINIWPHTYLEAMTNCKLLTLENIVYKYTLKKIMMNNSIKRNKFLKSTGIFNEWNDEQCNVLGLLSENMDFLNGEIIVHEGTPATHLYFVQSGICGANRILDETRIQIGTLSSGDVFGEAAVLDPINGIFPFTIIANTICKIIRIEKNYLNKKNSFELLRLGNLTKTILNKIKHFSIRCPEDHLLVQMIQDNCIWKLKRKKILKKFAKEMEKSNKKFLLPKVRCDTH